ncbi:DUF1799 domain-containing protein [Dyella caseinilytica]|uniref:DUF1799 domain-containing protein n=1 Tax=Dyella caseinilytica TaxID=1849581 RepID=A0ABX7GZG6_9GAMM|nr:DUF1799 domain-containing protein [Dyella caseinilytica]QRN55915.1 DUF1799 domain-containing protein [Dyella caseinilytica]
MAALGFALEDFPDHVEILPDNLAAVNVFIAMATQWRVSMGGPIGLDYNALPAVMRLVGVPRAEQSDTFECIRTMEGEALRVMAEQNK